jgi:hypothetical protein
MPYVATMGCASCATISIGWFKDQTKEMNEAFKVDPTSFTPPASEMSVNEFYTNVLYPTRQDLGRSYDMPLEKLMQDIDASSLKTKLVMCVLNHAQYHQHGKYWPGELNRWGFKLITKTKNTIGSVNYVFMRNPNEVEIEDGEA